VRGFCRGRVALVGKSCLFEDLENIDSIIAHMSQCNELGTVHGWAPPEVIERHLHRQRTSDASGKGKGPAEATSGSFSGRPQPPSNSGSRSRASTMLE
jgi:hypothetical protein